MGEDHPCNMKEIGTILIKMFDKMVQELKKVRYVPHLKKKYYLCWYFESIRFRDI